MTACVHSYMCMFVHIDEGYQKTKIKNRYMVYLNPFFFVLLRTKTKQNSSEYRTLMSYTSWIKLCFNAVPTFWKIQGCLGSSYNKN